MAENCCTGLLPILTFGPCGKAIAVESDCIQKPMLKRMAAIPKKLLLVIVSANAVGFFDRMSVFVTLP